MFIINQDRDELYFIQKPYIIDGKIVLYDNKTYFGINLYIDNVKNNLIKRVLTLQQNDLSQNPLCTGF